MRLTSLVKFIEPNNAIEYLSQIEAPGGDATVEGGGGGGLIWEEVGNGVGVFRGSTI
jgi:hypothetical protein